MDTNEIFETRKLEFVTPSGHKVTIREQNGADDDILSNPVEAANLMNLSRFIASIVVEADYFDNKKLTVDQAHSLPVLDRYAILFNSRIFSLGETLDFDWDWGESGKYSYEQNLHEFIFDYSQTPTEEELNAKPNAIPFYPEAGKFKDYEITTSSGKVLRFDLLTCAGEVWATNLALEKQTRNVPLMARNLRVKVGEKFEAVSNFSMFSVKDMREIWSAVNSYDPIFNGTTTIEHPVTHQKTEVSVVSMRDFFYPGEI